VILGGNWGRLEIGRKVLNLYKVDGLGKSLDNPNYFTYLFLTLKNNNTTPSSSLKHQNNRNSTMSAVVTSTIASIASPVASRRKVATTSV